MLCGVSPCKIILRRNNKHDDRNVLTICSMKSLSRFILNTRQNYWGTTRRSGANLPCRAYRPARIGLPRVIGGAGCATRLLLSRCGVVPHIARAGRICHRPGALISRGGILEPWLMPMLPNSATMVCPSSLAVRSRPLFFWNCSSARLVS